MLRHKGDRRLFLGQGPQDLFALTSRAGDCGQRVGTHAGPAGEKRNVRVARGSDVNPPLGRTLGFDEFHGLCQHMGVRDPAAHAPEALNAAGLTNFSWTTGCESHAG